jgi:hypothetical protein
MEGNFLHLNQFLEVRNAKYHYYSDITKWCDDDADATSEWLILSTTNYSTRPEADWNNLGREIHDSDRVAEHAFFINLLMQRLKLTSGIAQLRNTEKPWFGRSATLRNNSHRIEYVNAHFPGNKSNVPSFRGGYAFDNLPIQFVNLFIDYPFVNHYSDIEILCQHELLIRFTHHLSVDFIVREAALAKCIDSFFNESGLVAIQDNPRVYVRPLR